VISAVYSTGESERQGAAGKGWKIPCFESLVVPQGKGALAWKTPSGGVISLTESGRGFRDPSGEWTARITGPRCWIRHRDGWEFFYKTGRLEHVSSPTGRLLEFAYDGKWFSAMQVRDPATGVRRTLAKARSDRNGLVDLEIEGLATKFHRNQEGRLTGIEQERRPPRKFHYTEFGLLLGWEESGGGKHKFETVFNEPKHLGKEKQQQGDPEQEKLRIQTARKNPANYRLATDGRLKFEYSPNIVPGTPFPVAGVRVRDALGNTFASGADWERGMSASVDHDGNTLVSWYYLAPGKPYNGLLRRVERNGRLQAEYRYDRRSGLLRETVDGNGISLYYEYDSSFKPSRNLDWKPRPSMISRGVSRKKAVVIARYRYDDDGRLVEAWDADNGRTLYVHNRRGELIGMIDPTEVKSRWAYDGLGRLISASVGDRRESVEYDSNGRVAARVAPGGVRTALKYDEHGMVASVTVDGQKVSELKRDQNGAVIAQTDALGRETKVERDAKGRVLGVIDTGKRETRYEYDAHGRLTKQIDGNGNAVRFERDSAGRLTKQSNDAGQVFTWEYDAQGRLVMRNNGVQEIKTEYDEKNRPIRLRYQDLKGGGKQEVGYAYDAEGRMSETWNNDTKVKFFRDMSGREIARSLEVDGETYAIRFEYDGAGRRTWLALSQKAADGKYELLHQTNVSYWNDGTLKDLRANGRLICGYARDPLIGRLIRRDYGNGATGHYGYDSVGRLGWVKVEKGPLIAPLVLTYEWDGANQVTRRHWNGETAEFEYDAAGQLAAVLATKGSHAGSDLRKASLTGTKASAPKDIIEIYRYDKAGNLFWKYEHGETRYMTFDKANQVKTLFTPWSSSRFTYDKAGRMASETVDPYVSRGKNGHSHVTRIGRTIKYGYLDKVVEMRRSDGVTVKYGYWPDGQVAWKKRFGPDGKLQEREISVWDGLAILHRKTSGAPQESGRVTSYVAEPHISGGAVVATFNDPRGVPTYHINDLLSTTLVVVHPERVEVVPLTSFGRPFNQSSSEAGNLQTPDTPAESLRFQPVSTAATGLQLKPTNPAREEVNEP
jgi:YD repeat-containing protein